MLPAQVLLERHVGRDFMAKIAASSMKSPIFTAARSRCWASASAWCSERRINSRSSAAAGSRQ
eukprot:scaffold60670_cov33-Phaeocystis_antarctica.AAC.1